MSAHEVAKAQAMKLGIFSVFDDAIKAFNAPMFMRHRGEAIRSFTQAANDPASNLMKFSKDYHLYCLGEFDDTTGTFFPLDPPERVVSGLEVVEPS
jgi:hypothetical protein